MSIQGVKQAIYHGDTLSLALHLSTLQDINGDFVELGGQGILFYILDEFFTDVFTDVMDIILQHNPDLNKRDEDGQTILHVSTLDGNRKAMEHILKAGVDINAMDNTGRTALHFMCAQEDPSMTNLLLTWGADYNLADSLTGYSPLHYACHWQRVHTAALLIHAGADIDLLDNQGKTPYDYLEEAATIQLSRLLLDLDI